MQSHAPDADGSPQGCHDFLTATDLIYIKDSKIKDSKGRSARHRAALRFIGEVAIA